MNKIKNYMNKLKYISFCVIVSLAVMQAGQWKLRSPIVERARPVLSSDMQITNAIDERERLFARLNNPKGE